MYCRKDRISELFLCETHSTCICFIAESERPVYLILNFRFHRTIVPISIKTLGQYYFVWSQRSIFISLGCSSHVNLGTSVTSVGSKVSHRFMLWCPHGIGLACISVAENLLEAKVCVMNKKSRQIPMVGRCCTESDVWTEVVVACLAVFTHAAWDTWLYGHTIAWFGKKYCISRLVWKPCVPGPPQYLTFFISPISHS